MELVFRAAAACVLAALLALLLKKGTPELALALTVGAAAVVFLLLAGQMEGLLDLLREMEEGTGLDRELLAPLYKTIGIALVVRVGSGLCRDAGESALAAVLETVGTVCALLAAAPLLRQALGMLMELMRQ
ncbi:SpoIIIAC/SpoIIIAD family protein [Dysosmobacter sp.]|uniref:SpoIIIAC/SpoIIIAD family protein n=1 Tax=Dysosmobacter sp. TaxID=2591382 RepID=UPI002A89D677|nr:SpoIIIAC/SpoIIIAD family protein [Dysosmobacter sp.]MDY3282632.1 SpoIIIAC/SpoIIIAD family protein [Dysosmobacter sp.]